MGNMKKGNVGQEVEHDKADLDVGEFATGAFEALGVKVTHDLAKNYKRFKSLKDKIQPGRLKPADFVTIIMMTEKGM